MAASLVDGGGISLYHLFFYGNGGHQHQQFCAAIQTLPLPSKHTQTFSLALLTKIAASKVKLLIRF